MLQANLGCGQGCFGRQLAEVGAPLVGVDVSRAQIGHARRNEIERPLGIV